jgi:phosphoribosylformylglycinamidine synthase subunit PurSL
LALDTFSPATAVQLGDPLTQKRMTDFLLEARDLGLYRGITDNGAGGLSSSVGEMARISGGASIDVSLAKTKYPGLKPFELVISESQERMTVGVPPEKLNAFMDLAERRGVEVSHLGEFTQSGRFEIFYANKLLASLDLNFLHYGCPRLELEAEWKGRNEIFSPISIRSEEATEALLQLLGRPNIASKEWLIRQYDHEVQGMSVVKPLHTVSPGTSRAWSGPNDAGVVKPKPMSDLGLAIGCGINPKLSDIDPFLMAQSAVDEAVRNVLCVGAEYGLSDSILALVDNFCWPDPVGNLEKTAWLVCGMLLLHFLLPWFLEKTA